MLPLVRVIACLFVLVPCALAEAPATSPSPEGGGFAVEVSLRPKARTPVVVPVARWDDVRQPLLGTALARYEPLATRLDPKIVATLIEAPAADVGQSVAAYPFALGPAASMELPVGSGTFVMQGAVREVVGLERLTHAPTGGVPAGTFYIGPAGTLMVPAQYDAALVDYAWVDRTGYAHYVWDEYVGAGASVRASLPFLVFPKLVAPPFGRGRRRLF